jgi:hypothetical protein
VYLHLVGVDVACGDQGVAQFPGGALEFRGGRELADRSQEAAGVLADSRVPPGGGTGVGDEQSGKVRGFGLAGVVGGALAMWSVLRRAGVWRIESR